VIRTDDANLTSLFEKTKFEELLRSYLGSAMPICRICQWILHPSSWKLFGLGAISAKPSPRHERMLESLHMTHGN